MLSRVWLGRLWQWCVEDVAAHLEPAAEERLKPLHREFEGLVTQALGMFPPRPRIFLRPRPIF